MQRERPQPAVHKTPADYDSPGQTDMVLPTVPYLKVLGRQSQLWDVLLEQLGRLCLNDRGVDARLSRARPHRLSLTVGR